MGGRRHNKTTVKENKRREKLGNKRREKLGNKRREKLGNKRREKLGNKRREKTIEYFLRKSHMKSYSSDIL